MTENEATEAMQFDLKVGGEIHSQILRDAVDVAIQALEKQIPKRPIFNHSLSDTLSLFHCECGNAIKVSHDIGIMDNSNAPNYCSKCGCRLDWSDENEID